MVVGDGWTWQILKFMNFTRSIRVDDRCLERAQPPTTYQIRSTIIVDRNLFPLLNNIYSYSRKLCVSIFSKCVILCYLNHLVLTSHHRMPWCAHCRRNVSASTENLHRKHAKRPRLVAAAVQAFRLSEKLSKVKKSKPKRKTENAPSSHADPPAPTFDIEMEGYFEHDEMVDDGAPATDIEPHSGLQNTRVAIWPNGVRPY